MISSKYSPIRTEHLHWLRSWKTVLALSLLLTWSFNATAKGTTTITVYSRGDSTASYATSLIEMAMSKAQAGYTLDIKHQKKPAVSLRRMLKAGEVDIIWMATSEPLEAQFIPVRVPIFKGLMGYRTLLIKPEKQVIFDEISSLEELQQKATFGQVHSWADTAILEKNGLNITKVTKHSSLFNKLRKEAFDGAPRAIHETIQESAQYPEFAQEKNLLLHYPQPMYLFVTPGRPELAHQLTYGLTKAVQDGSLNVLFYRQPSVKQALEELQGTQRTLIELENYDLPAKTPLDDPKFWVRLGTPTNLPRSTAQTGLENK